MAEAADRIHAQEPAAARPKVVSPIEDFTKGKFQPPSRFPMRLRMSPQLRARRNRAGDSDQRQDLLRTARAAREQLKRMDVALIRIEQFYPFPDAAARSRPWSPGVLRHPVYWVQEEPENMGRLAVSCVSTSASRLFDRYPLGGIMRPASASSGHGLALQPSSGAAPGIGPGVWRDLSPTPTTRGNASRSSPSERSRRVPPFRPTGLV